MQVKAQFLTTMSKDWHRKSIWSQRQCVQRRYAQRHCGTNACKTYLGVPFLVDFFLPLFFCESPSFLFFCSPFVFLKEDIKTIECFTETQKITWFFWPIITERIIKRVNPNVYTERLAVQLGRAKAYGQVRIGWLFILIDGVIDGIPPHIKKFYNFVMR